MLVWTSYGLAASYVIVAYSESLEMLIVSRVVGGVMAANIGAAQAYMSDITTPETRAKGMGLLGAAFGLGFIFGPAIGGVLGGNDAATADFFGRRWSRQALQLWPHWPHSFPQRKLKP